MSSILRALIGCAVTIQAFALVTPAIASDGTPGSVQLIKRDGTVDVKIGGELFTTFRFGPELPKPYFYPVIGPGGKEVTRKTPVESGEDHPHQKSLWTAID